MAHTRANKRAIRQHAREIAKRIMDMLAQEGSRYDDPIALEDFIIALRDELDGDLEDWRDDLLRDQ